MVVLPLFCPGSCRRCGAIASAGLLGLVLAWPVLAGTSATLTVSVRVVERCAIAVPDLAHPVWDHVWHRLPAPVRARLLDQIEHRCQRRTPARIDVASGPPPWVGPRRSPAGRVLVAGRNPNSVLVTITY